MIRIYKTLPHLIFFALAAAILSPSLVIIENKWAFFVVTILIEGALIINHKSKPAHDVALIVFSFLFLWEFFTAKRPNPNTMLYPVPENVFAVMVTDWRKILTGMGSSMSLLFTAMFFALLLGISLGMMVGWFERPRRALFPIAKVISPIPPIIYSPYAIGVLPSFRAASLFIIFSSIFWPVFINTITNVSNVDRKILESAKTLNTRSLPLFLNILLPYCLPRLFTSMNVTLSTSFMVLTAAELIGAKSGLGYYVRFAADFANYTKVVAGIIIIGVVVTLLNRLLTAAQNLIVKWR
ncbi:MAG: ABC transporter permease subunit [Treponema sp.]|jgi:NitT/TauT family transport system permease protein|nr:ABC transporter permease subunit [Treponema sp.]